MPIRGIIFLLLVAIILGIIFRKEMYEWFQDLCSDLDDKLNDKTNTGGKEK